MSLAILFHLLCAQHVSDINISIFRSLRLCWWITTSVVLFSVRCVLELRSFCRLKPAKRTPPNTSRNKTSHTQRTENKTTDVVIHQHSRKLLKMDILMSEKCWAHKKWNKIASDIRLVFHSSIIAMMHGPINIRLSWFLFKYFILFTAQFRPPGSHITHLQNRVFRWTWTCRIISSACCSSHLLCPPCMKNRFYLVWALT